MTRRLVTLLLVGGLVAAACGGGGRPAAPVAERAPAQQRERERLLRFWERFEVAEALRRQGRWPEAGEVYAEALAADPDHEGALYGRANCLLELDRYEEARPYLLHLIELNPLSQRAHVQLAYLQSCPRAACCFDLEAARRELERAVAINREETGALSRLAEVDLALGRHDEARRVLEQVRATNSQSVGAPWLLAWLAERGGRSEEAAALLAEALGRSRGPAMPSAVPAEGDTRGDHVLVASTLPAKRLVPPVWEDLAERLGDGEWSADDRRAELARLDAALARAPAATLAP